MNDVTTRREWVRNAAFLIGGVGVCKMAGAASAPRSTCCDTPDLEAESLVFGEKSLTIDLAKAFSLGAVGTAAAVGNPERALQLIVVRTGEQEYRALSRLCTHGQQVVSYNEKRGILQCNNFNHSIFGMDGQVVKGPASTALKSYPVMLANGKLEIAL